MLKYDHYISAGWGHEEALRLAGLFSKPAQSKPKEKSQAITWAGWTDENVERLKKLKVKGYSNSKIDKLTDLILSETDLDKRNQMIKEAFQILNDEVGYIPLHQQALAWGKKDNIDLVQRADNQFVLNFVNIK